MSICFRTGVYGGTLLLIAPVFDHCLVCFSLRKLAHAINSEFLSFKNLKFLAEKFLYVSYFCSKHRSWVHVRTASASRL